MKLLPDGCTNTQIASSSYDGFPVNIMLIGYVSLL